MSNLLIIIYMLLAGSLIAIQGSANSALGKYLDHPLQAAVVSFSSGLLVLVLASVFLRVGLPQPAKVIAAPKFILIGGLLGAIFVTSVILCVPKVGVANVIIASLCGQILLSLALDHYGVMGMKQNPLNWSRAAGAALVVAGLFLINYKK